MNYLPAAWGDPAAGVFSLHGGDMEYLAVRLACILWFTRRGFHAILVQHVAEVCHLLFKNDKGKAQL